MSTLTAAVIRTHGFIAELREDGFDVATIFGALAAGATEVSRELPESPAQRRELADAVADGIVGAGR